MLVENIRDLQLFSLAIREGSITAAARELGVSLAVASKRLQRLEEQLGVRLLNRSTRHLSPTDEGIEFHHYVQRVLAELEEGETLVTRASQTPVGTLRVTVPAAFGRLHIAPLVPEFLSRYPQLKLSLHLSDGVVDLINDGYDLAVRIGELGDSNLVVRPLGRDQRVVVATPEYLSRHGEPQTPGELAAHNALLFASAGHSEQWSFTMADGTTESVRVRGDFETNNCDALRATIQAHHGIAMRPLWDVWEDVRAGRLVRLLKEYRPPSYPIQAVYPSRRHLPQKVRLFIDLLVERFGTTPYWELPEG